MPVIRRFTEVDKFAACVTPFLIQQEACNSLPLLIIYTLRQKSEPLGEGVYLAACLTDDARGQVIGVALRTPPRNLVLSFPFPAEAISAVQADCSDCDLPGIIGPAAEADAFAVDWCSIKSVTAMVDMHLGTYVLEEVLPPPPPISGHLRGATIQDAGLIGEWSKAIHAEAMRDSPPPGTEVDVTGWYFWEIAGKPVASVRAIPSTPKGATINSVYTPPPLRRRGYATAAVAAASEMMLNEGCRFCYLFTDMANPTSNRIYQRIGYRFTGDFRQISFKKRGEAVIAHNESD